MTEPQQPSGIIVRRAVATDVASLQANSPRPELNLPALRFSEQEQGAGVLAVAEVNSVIVGSGFLDFADEELTPEVKNLYVNADARRLGVGKAVWSWLEEQARAADYKQVFLAVDPNNEAAIPLFINMGYSPTGNHMFVDNPDRTQVADPSRASNHYAIYQKSLTTR